MGIVLTEVITDSIKFTKYILYQENFPKDLVLFMNFTKHFFLIFITNKPHTKKINHSR